MIISDLEEINFSIHTSQREQWSIHCNVVNYVQYNKEPYSYYKLDVKALES